MILFLIYSRSTFSLSDCPCIRCIEGKQAHKVTLGYYWMDMMSKDAQSTLYIARLRSVMFSSDKLIESNNCCLSKYFHIWTLQITLSFYSVSATFNLFLTLDFNPCPKVWRWPTYYLFPFTSKVCKLVGGNFWCIFSQLLLFYLVSVSV